MIEFNTSQDQTDDLVKYFEEHQMVPCEDTSNLIFDADSFFMDYFPELEKQVAELKEQFEDSYKDIHLLTEVEFEDSDCDCDCGVEEDVNPDPRFAAWERKFKTAFV